MLCASGGGGGGVFGPSRTNDVCARRAGGHARNEWRGRGEEAVGRGPPPAAAAGCAETHTLSKWK